MILARSHIEDRSERGHILVCAPSNAAVDEIVFRIAKRGLISYSGKKKPADILRIGAAVFDIDGFGNRVALPELRSRSRHRLPAKVGQCRPAHRTSIEIPLR